MSIPRQPWVLTDSDTLARHDDAWRIAVEKRGRCYQIQPSERWDPVFSAGGLVIMRKTPPQPGIPPLYFRVDGPQARPGGAGPAPVSSAGGLSIRPAPVGESPGGNAGTAADRSPSAGDLDRAAYGGGRSPTQAPMRPTSAPIPSPVPPTPPMAEPAPPAPDTPALDRGYALGFGIAIILIIVLLAGFALLLRILLRAPPEIAPAPAPTSARPSQPGPPLIRLPLLSQSAPEVSEAPDQPMRQDCVADASGPNAEMAEKPEAVMRDAPAFVYAESATPILAPIQATPALPVMAASYAELLTPAQPEPGSPEDAHARSSDIDRATPRTRRSMSPVPPCFPTRVGMPISCVAPARIMPTSWQGGAVAFLPLRCLPDMMPVDEDAVEQACLARERERADLGVIVSNGFYSKDARKLAAQTGIDLCARKNWLTSSVRRDR